MALNIKDFIPELEHPPVTHPVLESRAQTSDDKPDHFDLNSGARQKALETWWKSQERFRSADKTQLLDVL